jgi:FkbM family methyltransferase
MTDWLHSLLQQTTLLKEVKATWLDGGSPIFIYGTGSMARDVQHIFSDCGLAVCGFIDHLEGRPLMQSGLPVFRPEAVHSSLKTNREPVIVLGIHNYLADIPQIVHRLKACGLERIMSPVDLYDFYGRELGPRYWLASRDFYPPKESELEQLLALWSDEASQTLCRLILEFRIHGDASRLPAPDLENQYHPMDIPAWKTPLRLVDCGAFDGDTLAGFLRKEIRIESVAAFEPDPQQFGKLSQFVAAHREKLPNVHLWPCGVFSCTRQLNFEGGQGMSSSISASGGAVIQCVALDEALPTFAPTLIKMDIEGAEYDGLLGARRMIEEHLPGLAIALYHRPEHLWQIPFWVEGIAPGKYKYYLRSHALNDFELVFYAIPDRRI